jgi:methyltransferase
LAGHIARALAVFCVDEVIIFDDGYQNRGHNQETGRPEDSQSYTGYDDPNQFLARILSYLETPPVMRKHLFPIHPDLRTAGTLPSLDMPHHLRQDEWCQYREGVVLGEQDIADFYHRQKPGNYKAKGQKPTTESPSGSNVDVGFSHLVSIPVKIPSYTRVTVKFKNEDPDNTNFHEATVVSPEAPRKESGYYWGYSIRPATSLSAVFTESPFEGGYDVSIGTSERGKPLSELLKVIDQNDSIVMNGEGEKVKALTNYSHLLLVFGGVAGLEVAVKNDEELNKMGVEEPAKLFDWWVNLCPAQGSRTIRTEEAVWLGLMGFRDIVVQRG